MSIRLWIALVALACVSPADAADVSRLWGEEGSAVTEAIGGEWSYHAVPDGTGGAYFLGYASGPSPFDLQKTPPPMVTLEEGPFLQRLDAHGRRPWRRDGLQPPAWVERVETGAASDGRGGVLVSLVDYDNATLTPNRVQRYDADGRPLWGADGVALFSPGCTTGASCGSARYPSTFVSDRKDGAIFTWSDLQNGPAYPQIHAQYAQRIGPDGQPLFGPSGVQIHTGSASYSTVLADGGGGMIFVFEPDAATAPPGIRARKIGPDGQPGWGGALVDFGADLFRRWERPVRDWDVCLTSDGGVLAAWVDERPTEDLYVDVYAQKIDADGNVAWGESGVPVSTRPLGQLSPVVACDEEGGGYVFFEDTLTDGEYITDYVIRGQRFSSAGEPLWAQNGIFIDEADSPMRSTSFWPVAVPDERGGAIVVWSHFGIATDANPIDWDQMAYVAQRVTPEGELVWGHAGFRVHQRVDHDPDGWGPSAVTIADGAGGAIVSYWVDGGLTYADLGAQRVNDTIAAGPRAPFLLVEPRGRGTGVVRTAGGLDCGLRCGVEVAAGASTTLVAAPDRGSAFAGWGGDCKGTGPCTLVMNGDRFVTASFKHAPDQIGIYRPSEGGWYLDLDGDGKWDGCFRDGCHAFGIPGDAPIVGDWSGQGFSAIGVHRAGSGSWFLDFDGNGSWGGCSVDGCLAFGGTKDVPLAGDWSNQGVAGIGVVRSSIGYWWLDWNADGEWGDTDRLHGPFGAKTDLPVAGDWIGDGRARIGVFRPSSGYWMLDGEGGNGSYEGCALDKCLGPFGMKGDRPVVGDWTGSGKASIGVFRPSTGYWYLDLDGDGGWDGCSVDACLGPFGTAADVPVVGHW